MQKPYPKELRDDVVAVARPGQGPLTQIVKDFRIWQTGLSNWLKKADWHAAVTCPVAMSSAANVRSRAYRMPRADHQRNRLGLELLAELTTLTRHFELPSRGQRPRCRWPSDGVKPNTDY